MTGLSDDMRAHLATGLTTICRCWDITRPDGMVLGFTDHDRDLEMEGILYRADTGMSAVALQQTTGLSVDNTEALGALSDTAIREEDIDAGRYDAAEIRAWLVNWADPDQRHIQFRGTIGEIRRAQEGFEAELRGLTQPLNLPLGRAYQKPCAAVLGDAQCRINMDKPEHSVVLRPEVVKEQRVFWCALPQAFEPRWFQHGRLVVLDGPAKGLTGMIKRDREEDGLRVIELWHPIRASVEAEHTLRIEAGCDKHFGTCRGKFDNVRNFRGFPDIPGDDWSITDPTRATRLAGGSRR